MMAECKHFDFIFDQVEKLMSSCGNDYDIHEVYLKLTCFLRKQSLFSTHPKFV